MFRIQTMIFGSYIDLGYEIDDAEQIAAGNAGWPVQFRFAVHAGWSRVPELWTLACYHAHT